MDVKKSLEKIHHQMKLVKDIENLLLSNNFILYEESTSEEYGDSKFNTKYCDYELSEYKKMTTDVKLSKYFRVNKLENFL